MIRSSSLILSYELRVGNLLQATRTDVKKNAMVGPRMICLSVKEKSFQGNCTVSDLLKSKSKLGGSGETCELSGCSADDLSVRLIHKVSSQKLASFKHEAICPNYRRSFFPMISPRALCLPFYNFEFELGLLFVKLHCACQHRGLAVNWLNVDLYHSERRGVSLRQVQLCTDTS